PVRRLELRLRHRELILRVLERVLRLYGLMIEFTQAPGARLLQHDVGRREIAIRVGLLQLRLVVAIVDPRQQVADLDALPFLDRLGDYLAENLGADHDVLVLRHDIAAAGQHGAGLSRPFHRDDRGFYFGRTANGPLIDEKSGRAGHRENREHDRGRDDSARLLRVGRTRNPQRLELADIGPPGGFSGQGQTLLSASTIDIFI